MDDIASLGFVIDSAPAVKATGDLNSMTAASERAQASAQGLGQAHTLQATQTKRAADEMRAAGAVNDNYTAQQRNVIKALNDGIAAVGLSGRQFAVQTALTKANTSASSEAGQAIALLAGRQFDLQHSGEHATESLRDQRLKFRALGEAANELGGGPLASVIQQAGFLTIGSQHLSVGIIASTVAVGGLVGSVVLLISVLKAAAALSETAQLSNIGGQALQGIATAGAYKGVDPAALAAGMVKFNEQVDLAKTGLGSLAPLFRANGISAKSTEDAFFKVADLVKNTTDESKKFSIIQQAGLPVSNQMVTFLSQGADMIRKQSSEASKLTDQQLKDARELNDKWNEVWTDFTTAGKKAIVDVFTYMRGLQAASRTLWDPSAGGQGQYDQFGMLIPGSGKVGSSTAGSGLSGGTGPLSITVTPKTPTVDPEDLKKQLALQQQIVAAYGLTATVEEQVAIKQKELAIAGLTLWGIDKDRLKVVLDLVREQANGVAQVKASIDSTNVSNATVGMAAGQAAEYTAVQTKLNEAIRNHAPLSAEDEAALRKWAATLGAATQAAAENKAQNEATFAQQTAFLSATDQQIASVQRQLHGDGVNGWQAFMNDGLAATMRLTAGLKQINDAAGTFASGFLKDIDNHVAPMEALANQAKILAQNIIDIASKQAVSSALSGLFGGLGQGATQTASITTAAGIWTAAGETFNASLIAAATVASGIMTGATATDSATKISTAVAVGEIQTVVDARSSALKLATALESAAATVVSGAVFEGFVEAAAAVWAFATQNWLALIAAAIAATALAFGLSSGQSNSDKRAQQAANDNVQTLIGTVGGTTGSVQSTNAQLANQNEQAVLSLNGKNVPLAWQMMNATSTAMAANIQQFQDQWQGMLDALKAGLGNNSPFSQARSNVEQLATSIKDFVNNTSFVGGNVGAAQQAGQQALLSMLQAAPSLSNVQTTLQTIHGTADALSDALTKLGMSSQQAADAINSGVSAAINALSTNFSAGLTARLNTANGQDYLNSITSLLTQHQSDLADAAALGLTSGLANSVFAQEAQKIINDANVAGDAFDEDIFVVGELEKAA
jgi:hypothetical protein